VPEGQTYCYAYPRPMFMVDAVVFTVRGRRLEVLLIERKHEPFAGHLALPGGFVDEHEPLSAAVARELAEETGLEGVALEQFRTFGAPGRDPRGWSISAAFLALVDASRHAPKADDDAARVDWFPVATLGPLAFDHSDIVETATARLRELACYAAVGAQLLPDTFTLGEIADVHAAIRDGAVDAPALEQFLCSRGIVECVGTGRYRFATGEIPRF